MKTDNNKENISVGFQLKRALLLSSWWSVGALQKDSVTSEHATEETLVNFYCYLFCHTWPNLSTDEPIGTVIKSNNIDIIIITDG